MCGPFSSTLCDANIRFVIADESATADRPQNALQMIEQLVEDCYQAEKQQSTTTTTSSNTTEPATAKPSEPVAPNESQSKDPGVRLVGMEKLLKVDSPGPGEKRECINCECQSKKSVAFYKAPLWALNHYNVSRKVNRGQYVCESCYDVAADDYERMCVALINQRPLLLEKLPIRPEVVEILDSDDEDSGGGTNKYVDTTKPLSVDTLTMLEDHFEDVLKETFERINIQQQTTWTNQILKVESPGGIFIERTKFSRTFFSNS